MMRELGMRDGSASLIERIVQMAKTYSSWAEFEREEIRPCFRIGFSIDDLEDLLFEGVRYDDDPDEDDFTDNFGERYGR